MENYLYYHFWMLKDTEIPFDIEKDYCYLPEANDKKFIASYMVNREYLKYLFEDKYFPELLNIYLNVLYDENHPEDIKNKAIDWISHTIEILLEADIFYNFINLKILEHIVKDFKPSNKINVLKLDENKIPQWMSLDRSDPFFSQIITVNINLNPSINSPLNIPINIPISIPIDDPFDTPKIANTNKKKGEFCQKVTTVAIYELFRLFNISTAHSDLTKICRLISALTSNSYDSIHNDLDQGINFAKSHSNEINDINQLFKDLNIGVNININNTYR